MSNNILGQVIRILNSTTLIINVGYDRLSKGDYIDILGEKFDISDPFTKENLGEYYHKKDTLKVIETHKSFSVAKAYKTEKVETNLAQAMNPLLRTERRTIPLNINEDENENIIFNENTINIGDSVSESTNWNESIDKY